MMHVCTRVLMQRPAEGGQKGTIMHVAATTKHDSGIVDAETQRHCGPAHHAASGSLLTCANHPMPHPPSKLELHIHLAWHRRKGSRPAS